MHALFKIKKGRGKMKNKRNALGISAMIIFLIYILLTGYEWSQMWGLGEEGVFLKDLKFCYENSLKELSFSYILIAIEKTLYLLVLMMWFIYFIFRRKISRKPLIITLGYWIFRLIDSLILSKITVEYGKSGIIEKSSWLKDHWSLIVIVIAWFLLIYGMKMINKIIFIIIRGGFVIWNISHFVHGVMTNIKFYGAFKTYINFNGIYFVMTPITWNLTMVFFMLYLLKDELFYEKDVNEILDGIINS